MIPSLFLVTSIGSGLEEIIENNLTAPSVYQLISTPSIFIPLIAFFFVCFDDFNKKVFFKKNKCFRYYQILF